MQVHAAARISQLEERSIRKNNQQVNQLLKPLLENVIIGQYQIED